MAEIKNFLTENRFFAVVGAAGFLTLSFLLYTYAPRGGHYEVDSSAYERVAQGFVKTGAIQEPGGQLPIHTQGYHFFLGMIYLIFGDDLWKAISIHVLLALLSIFLTTQTAFLLCGVACARIVFALALIDGAFLIYPQFLLAETLLLFLLTLFFERGAKFYCTKKRTYLVQAGLILGLSIIVKPTALFLPMCIAVCFFIFSPLFSYSLTWQNLLLFGSCVYFPVVLYIIRNGVVFGYYKLSYLTECGLFFNYNALLVSKIKNIPLAQAQAQVMALADTRYNSLEFAYWKNMASLFYENVVNAPLVVVSLWVQNLIKTFFGLFTVQLQLLFDPSLRDNILPFFDSSGSLVMKLYSYFLWAFRSPVIGCCMLFEFVSNGVRWILVLFGIQKMWAEKSYEKLLFFFCVIASFSFITGFFGAGRYRAPFEPLLLILAAQGILSLYKIAVSFTGSDERRN